MIILFVSRKLSAALKTVGTLLLLLVAFPFNLLLVSIALIWKLLTIPFQKPVLAKNPKKVLITGGKMTKALQLARLLHQAGHEITLVETHKYWLSGHRFSFAVKNFYTVPAPEKDAEAYCQGLLDIVKRENINVVIPVSSPVASYYDSLAKTKLKDYCEVLHFEPEMTKMLDDKYSLCQKAAELGLSSPKSLAITNPQQVLDFNFASDGHKYILKSIPYDSVTRLDLTQLPFEGMETYVRSLRISKNRPWTMQQFITGQEYCTHSTVRNGQIRLHCCSKSSPFQVNYEQVDNPQILAWVEEFVRKLNLTGQISFDFIQTEDGTVYPVECNPRTHSAITMFYNHSHVAKAYLTDAENEDEAPITPLSNSRPTYWTYHELWRLTGIRSFSDLQAWIQKVTQGTDAIFQLEDPLPFLMVHHWQIPLLLIGNLLRLKDWVKIDFNIGKLVEIGGD